MPQLFRVVAPFANGEPDWVRQGLVGFIFPHAQVAEPMTMVMALYPSQDPPSGETGFAVTFADAMQVLAVSPDLRDWFLATASPDQQAGYLEFDPDECEFVPDLAPAAITQVASA